MNTPAKHIILKELEDQTHPERVEDVIYWALKEYANSANGNPTFGRLIASTIVSEIDQIENKIPNN